MTDHTPNGWPYPIGTDRVMDGDDAIRALAEMLENRLRGGVASGIEQLPAPGALNETVQVTVTLPPGRFSAAPVVVVSCEGPYPERINATLTLDDPTFKTFKVNACRMVGPLNPMVVHWVAHAEQTA